MLRGKNFESTSVGLLGVSVRVPQTGWIKQRKFITSQFWRTEVQKKCAYKVGSFWGL